MSVFRDIAESSLLCKSSIILFLNKLDLLGDHLARSAVSDHFPECIGNRHLQAKTINWPFLSLKGSL
jgi:hypothetical protein